MIVAASDLNCGCCDLMTLVFSTSPTHQLIEDCSQYDYSRFETDEAQWEKKIIINYAFKEKLGLGFDFF